jgi:hypothetical protein
MSLPEGTRLVVRRGDPTDEETVAVLLALDTVARVDAAAAERARPKRPPAWVRAVRQESVGGRNAGSPTDLGGWPGRG